MALAPHVVFLLGVSGALLLTDSVSAGCPYGWSGYGSSCYKVYGHQRTMVDAERTCIYFGGNLASIQSYGEYCFIRSLIYKACHYHARAYIGLHDGPQEGKWMWTDGTKVTYTYWASHRPNNIGNEDCTEVNFYGRYWNDIPCTTRRAFVCEL